MPAKGRSTTLVGEEKLSAADRQARVLSRLRAMILLGGNLRPSELLLTTGRAVVDLPVEPSVSLLDLWSRQLEELAERYSLDSVSLRVALDRRTPAPRRPRADSRVRTLIERDAKEFRGTGGLVRDMTLEYGQDDYVLVANAGQVLTRPLSELARNLAETRADVAIAACAAGSPSGLSLVRCGALEAIPEIGFVDLKEQGLTRITEDHEVRVVEHQRPHSVAIRDWSDYMNALRAYHRGLDVAGADSDDSSLEESGAESTFEEDGFATFTLIEDGAEVDERAHLHDAVVLRGASVSADATVIRSVVTDRSSVGQGKLILDRIISEGAGVADVEWADGSRPSPGPMRRLAGIRSSWRSFARLRPWLERRGGDHVEIGS